LASCARANSVFSGTTKSASPEKLLAEPKRVTVKSARPTAPTQQAILHLATSPRRDHSRSCELIVLDSRDGTTRSPFNLSRCLSTLLFVVLGLPSVKADTVPVTWSGSPTATCDSAELCEEFGFFPTITESQNGPAADVYEGFGTGIMYCCGGSGASIDTPFTITSEASVELAVAADYSGYGTSCTPVNCDPSRSWTFEGAFSGQSEIVDSSGNVDLDLTWGGSESIPCSQGIFAGDCVGEISVASDVSGVLDLMAGNYTLVTYESSGNNSIGQNQTGVSVQESLDPGTAVPEPSGLWLVLAFGASLFFCRRRSVRLTARYQDGSIRPSL